MLDLVKDGVLLRVRVVPNSSVCAICEVVEGANNKSFLKIKIRSIPEKNKANIELTAFLAKALDIPKSAFEIVGGKLDKYKKILIKTNNGAMLAERLKTLIKEA